MVAAEHFSPSEREHNWMFFRSSSNENVTIKLSTMELRGGRGKMQHAKAETTAEEARKRSEDASGARVWQQKGGKKRGKVERGAKDQEGKQ